MIKDVWKAIKYKAEIFILILIRILHVLVDIFRKPKICKSLSHSHCMCIYIHMFSFLKYICTRILGREKQKTKEIN